MSLSSINIRQLPIRHDMRSVNEWFPEYANAICAMASRGEVSISMGLNDLRSEASYTWENEDFSLSLIVDTAFNVIEVTFHCVYSHFNFRCFLDEETPCLTACEQLINNAVRNV